MKKRAPLADQEMPLTGHLAELRKRLIRIVLAAVVGFAACYAFSERILDIILLPLLRVLPPDSPALIFTGPVEPFIVYIKTAALAGFFLASPVIFYQLWAFVSPGLYPKERKYVFPFVFFATLFFSGGALFGYFILFPYIVNYLIGFSRDVLQPFISLKEYFSFATMLLIAFGLVFETPIIVFFLISTRLVSAGTMIRSTRYVAVAIFVLAAIITPPDIISQVIVGIPMIGLYLLGILSGWIFSLLRKKEKTETEE
jgi:sec-independent protein translocase protein TatC